MPRPPRRPHPQLELGLTGGPATPTTPPAWDALPEPAQRTLRSLLSRLLIAHAGDLVPEQGARARGDADER
jgi:hypothetical protein